MSKTVMHTSENAELVYSTPKSTLRQCDKTERFYLSIENFGVDLKFCELIKLRNKIYSIDIMAMMDTSVPDIEIIYFPLSDRVLVLNLFNILELKDLLAGTFVMLELNSILHRKIYRAL